jgi:hypothetical protein
VSWDAPAPIVGQCLRGQPRKQGRVCQLATLLQTEPSTEPTVLLDGKAERGQVVGRGVWWRDVTSKVQVVVVVPMRAPILLVSTDLRLPLAAIIELYAAHFPMKLSPREVKPPPGLRNYLG